MHTCMVRGIIVELHIRFNCILLPVYGSLILGSPYIGKMQAHMAGSPSAVRALNHRDHAQLGPRAGHNQDWESHQVWDSQQLQIS